MKVQQTLKAQQARALAEQAYQSKTSYNRSGVLPRQSKRKEVRVRSQPSQKNHYRTSESSWRSQCKSSMAEGTSGT